MKKLLPGVGSTGLDDGPYLPGKAPRKKPAAKTPAELAEIRRKAWATRRSPSPHSCPCGEPVGHSATYCPDCLADKADRLNDERGVA